MAVKLLVREIAQADKDINLLQGPLSETITTHSDGKRIIYTAAYDRLVQLIRRLQNAEVSVSGK